MSNKLKNVQAVRELQAGTHRFQTRRSFPTDTTSKPKEIREVGDVWLETDARGLEWEVHQMKGYQRRLGRGAVAGQKALESIHYPNCFTDCDKKRTSLFGHGDSIMNSKTGRCIDCQSRFEGSLKYQGKFDEYAWEKMKSNAESFFKEADREVEVMVRAIEKMGYANSDGSIEKWEMQDPEGYVKHIREQYDTYKQQILDGFDERLGKKTKTDKEQDGQ